MAEITQKFPRCSTRCPNKFWIKTFLKKYLEIEFDFCCQKKIVKLKGDMYCLARM